MTRRDDRATARAGASAAPATIINVGLIPRVATEAAMTGGDIHIDIPRRPPITGGGEIATTSIPITNNGEANESATANRLLENVIPPISAILDHRPL